MSWNTVKHFFLAGCWRNESILPGPGDILRLTDLLARDRLLCLPSAAPFPFSSSLARSLPLLFFSLPLSACLPACSRSQMKPAPCSLSVCLSLAGRFHTTMASWLCNGKTSFVLPQPAAMLGALPPPGSAGKHVPACRSPPRMAHLAARHLPPPCQGGSS